MRHLRNLGLLLVVALTLSGCASINADRGLCAFAGALAAGAIGAGVSDDDEIEEGAAIGAALGALGGAILCQRQEEPPAPEPEPEPAPAPAPQPELDSDGDGVPDSRDECPGTAPGTPVDARGCPEIPDLQGVHFEFDKATLTPEAQAILDSAIEAINMNPSVRVEIVGHTDSIGSDEYNQRLSERRAQAVKDYLASKGISESRLDASGRGESEPIASNETAEGRAANRRVELTSVEIRTY